MIRTTWPPAGLRGGLGLKAVQANFNPALGFVSRSGVRDTTADAGYTLFTSGSFLQSVFAGIDAQRIDLLDGGLQTQVIVGRLAEVRTTAGEQARVQYSATREVVTEPFTIYSDNARRVVVPARSYSFGETELNVQTARQRTVSGSLRYRIGDFYGGDRRNVVGQVSWTQSRYFAMTLRYDWNNIGLPQGDFITRLMRLSAEVNFSSTLYWINLIQYDNVSEVMGINSRLRWIPRAGQEGFLVFNHRLEDRDRNNTFRPELMDLSAKISYTFRF